MSKSNMNFAVNENAVVCNIIDGEIRARMATRNNPQKKQQYIERGIIESSNAITRFMHKHPNVFGNRKLIHSDGSNFFGGILPIASLSETPRYKDMLKSRMEYEYELTPEELSGMDEFIEDLNSLRNDPEVQEIVNQTVGYKNSIERVWKKTEKPIMEYIKAVLGYEPENIGKVSTYIMYPNFDTHRSCQLSDDKTFLFFAKSGETDTSKILAYLAHQAVHQPMLPYKTSMTREEKQDFHAFIKFLTDKDVYNQLSGKSYLDIQTQGENGKTMGKVYPFWLGYRYRNADKDGLNTAQEIESAIRRDKSYYDSLPQNSKKRDLYSSYEFDKLDANKIAGFFKQRRGITPYEFAKIDFNDKSIIYKSRFLEAPDSEGR